MSRVIRKFSQGPGIKPRLIIMWQIMTHKEFIVITHDKSIGSVSKDCATTFIEYLEDEKRTLNELAKGIK